MMYRLSQLVLPICPPPWASFSLDLLSLKSRVLPDLTQ